MPPCLPYGPPNLLTTVWPSGVKVLTKRHPEPSLAEGPGFRNSLLSSTVNTACNTTPTVVSVATCSTISLPYYCLFYYTCTVLPCKTHHIVLRKPALYFDCISVCSPAVLSKGRSPQEKFPLTQHRIIL